ncbi:MAG: ABC transporter ATP-binding protein [Alphaproteobacteria bacterium]|nr:MAG: ABC transporter ATP-binding protein [Alphaproteobacteria bacterium]
MIAARFQSLFADPYGAPALIRRLLAEHALRHRKLYVVAFALMGVAALCTALSAYLLGDVVNQAYVHKNFNALILVGAAAFGLFALKGAASYGQQVIMLRIGNRIIADNQRRMFDKLLIENIGFFSNRHSSEFVARLTTGAIAANLVLSLLITSIGRDVLTLLGLFAVMVVQDPVMSLFGLVIAPPAMIVLRKLVRRVRAIIKVQFTGGVQTIETLQETLQGLRVVKAFTLEEEMRRRFDVSVSAVLHEADKWARVANRASPLMETLGGLAVCLAIIYSGYLMIYKGAAPGSFISFLTAFLMAYEPAKRLARLNLELNNHLVGVRMLFEVMDSPATEPADDNKPALKLTTARVEFADVRFSYRANEPVLRGMSFTAEPGKVTALVGPSGGGKSTVLSLLLRFYEVAGGTITIDGQNIAAVSRKSLRRQIAYVGQTVHLFRGSVRDNIRYGKLDASEAEIAAAARAAHAHDFIMAFPQGYDTPVGEHGMQLSGGQRQRIEIARALIKDAPIILLDEATAALDSESERHVQEAIAELCKGRTTLVIAHRLSTIMHADRILVIENGAMIESGRHDELLRKSGRYASFYRLQLQEHTPAAAE